MGGIWIHFFFFFFFFNCATKLEGYLLKDAVLWHWTRLKNEPFAVSKLNFEEGITFCLWFLGSLIHFTFFFFFLPNFSASLFVLQHNATHVMLGFEGNKSKEKKSCGNHASSNCKATWSSCPFWGFIWKPTRGLKCSMIKEVGFSFVGSTVQASQLDN